jgi:hypothetical protein
LIRRQDEAAFFQKGLTRFAVHGRMIAPVVICNGVIRSGSTWSYNVCRILGQILAKRRSQHCGMACLGDKSLDQFLKTEVFRRDGPAVIKTHEIGPVALEWIGDGRAKAVCSFRDPRDCVASDIPFFGAGFEASVRRVAVSLQAVHASQSDSAHNLFIRYEHMMTSRLGEIRRIAAFLDIPISPNELELIDAQTNIEMSRKVAQAVPGLPQSQTDPVTGGHRRERMTLLHDNHIGSAKIGRWKEDLTIDQAWLVTRLFEASLRALGYEVEQPLRA